MKAYKGFNKDMTCRGFQYEEGKEYECEGKVKVCENGFHACERPLDCFEYYNPAESVYHEVELDGDISESTDDTKVAASKIKVGARLNVLGLVKAQFEYVKSKTTHENTDSKVANAGYRGAANAGYRGAANAGDCGAANAGYRGAANAGYRGAANAGDCGAANVGNYGAANAGDYGAANAGDYGAANAGYRGAANVGNYGAANAGDYGAANAGYRGAANAGYCGAAISRGTASVGKHGVAIARGSNSNNCKVKGDLGAVLIIVQEQEENYDIKNWKAVVVDGTNIKPDTWYKLENGIFVEVENETDDR